MRAWLAGLSLGVIATTMTVSNPYHMPDSHMMTGDFVQIWGAGGGNSFDSRADLPGEGVVIWSTLAGGEGNTMGIGDPFWPISDAAAAGFVWDDGADPGPCTFHPHITSLHIYDGYEMVVSYLDGPPGSTINMALFLNTGLTGPSGCPSSDWRNDTFWGGTWVELAVGETVALQLDFNAAEAWNIEDNLRPHTGWDDPLVSNGDIYAINTRDRREISNIGIQLGDFDGDIGGAQVLVGLNVPEPATITACLLGLAALALARRRS